MARHALPFRARVWRGAERPSRSAWVTAWDLQIRGADLTAFAAQRLTVRGGAGKSVTAKTPVAAAATPPSAKAPKPALPKFGALGTQRSLRSSSRKAPWRMNPSM
jgi:hypothetical protein